MAFNSSKISALQGSTGATGADGADGVDGIAGDGTGDVITVGTPADSYIGVWTADNSMEGTSSLVFDSTGLGIGTSSPSTILHCASSAARIICQSTGNSNSTIDIRADGTGDSQIWFDLAGTSPFAIGVDNSDGDKFKISGGYQLGTNDRLTIDSAGRVTVKKSSNSEIATLTSSSNSTAVDMNAANNFSLALDEDTTLAQPTNITAGQSGAIVITQDTGGLNTMDYHAYWKFEGGVAPELSESGDAVDTLVYYAASTTSIHAVLLKDMS